MGYEEGLLAGGEVVVLRARQHWMALLVGSRRALVLLALGALAWILGGVVLAGVAPFNELFGWVAAACVVVAVGLFLVRLWQWLAQDYLVTNRRVLKVEGILSKRSADSSLDKINDAMLRQDVLGRLLGYGDLTIMTAAEGAVDRYRMLEGAPRFKREMLDQKRALEMEISSRTPPSPPIRSGRPAPYAEPPRSAGEPTPGYAGEPTPPRAEPRPLPANAAEVMDILDRLADLRDRGAITPAEYDAKKADLLSRL